MADKDLDTLRESLRPGFSKGNTPKAPAVPEFSKDILEGIIQLNLTVNALSSEMVKLKESLELFPRTSSSSAEVLEMFTVLTAQQNSLKADIAKISSQLGYSADK